MFSTSGNTTFSGSKKETQRELSQQASQDINTLISDYMAKEGGHLIETLNAQGITGEKAQKVLMRLREKLQARLVIEASKNIKEFKEAAKRGDFSWMTQDDSSASDKKVTTSSASK